MIEKLNVDFKYEDDRGSLIQLVHEGYEQVNVLYSAKGTIRGGHYHKETSESFYIINGSVSVKAKYGEKEIYYKFMKGDFFLIKPFVVHSMEFAEDCLMVQLYSKTVERDNGSKDIFRVK